MFGHLIHAAGVTEALICLQAIRHNVAPPTINFHTRDPKCDLDYVPNEAREMPVRTALNNSFGFGGQNVSVLLGGYEGSV
jgi:3-oxoacyl-[acyl-carrier-protein] synthase II